MDPLKLTTILRGQVGEVRYARVLGDGNLLVCCRDEGQVKKVKGIGSVGKVKITKVIRV